VGLQINGRTKLAGVVGWPLGHTLSPAMHNAAYDAMRLNWVYLPLPVKDESGLIQLCEAARVLPFVGFNVTMPYKQAMLALCDEVAMLAKLAGAVNTVHCVDGRLIGYNTDGRGFLEALGSETDFVSEGISVAMIGAGGAAGAAIVSLILGKAARITIVNRTLGRAEKLIERLGDRVHGTQVSVALLDEGAADVVRSADLVVNATPVGMSRDDPSPIPSSWLRSGQVVADMVYRPEPTALLLDAAAAGATTVGGMGMLVAQGAVAIDIWNESAQSRTPRDVMRAAAAEMLSGSIATFEELGI